MDDQQQDGDDHRAMNRRLAGLVPAEVLADDAGQERAGDIKDDGGDEPCFPLG